MTRLPIHDIQAPLLQHLEHGRRLVLTAPTGSGKSTQVPRLLMESPQAAGQIIVLQPRRLAARLLAQRVAWELGQPVGQAVGYQTRHDSVVGPGTVIRFITEGLFLRLLEANPTLQGVGAVVLDEFHERRLATDLALAMVKDLQNRGRTQAKLVVMSATLDAAAVSGYLDCPVLSAGGRLFPVEMSYLPQRSTRPVWDLAAAALGEAVAGGLDGDVLIFMPGVYEIRRTIEACRRACPADQGLEFFPLYSDLPAAQQDQALGPCPGRKVIVATNVAETSITIPAHPGRPGLRCVIDSGLVRTHRYDPRRGINVLLVERHSQSSADQRAGRAGRTAPGECRRLWTLAEHRARPAQDQPEIARLDLAEAVLTMKGLGVADVASFDWLQPPSALALETAIDLLRELGALDPAGELTAAGRRMAGLPMHPRLARFLLHAAEHAPAAVPRAALWAALLSEGEVTARGGAPAPVEADEGVVSDLLLLERAYEQARRADFDPGRCQALGVHAQAARQVQRTERLFTRAVAERPMPSGPAPGGRGPRAARCTASTVALVQGLLRAFPDHLARRRGQGANRACALTGGRRGVLDRDTVIGDAELLLALDIREVGAGAAAAAGVGRQVTRGASARAGAGAVQPLRQEVQTVLSLCTAIEPAWLDDALGDRITDTSGHRWNPESLCVEWRQERALLGLVLTEKSRPDLVEPHEAAGILAERVLDKTLRLERWDDEVEQWLVRTRCVAQWFPERRLIAYDADDLRVVLHELCRGAWRYSQIRDRPCLEAVRNALSWEDQQFVERMAPTRLQLPGLDHRGHKRWLRLEYQAGAPPRGRARIQELYDVTEAITVAGGRQAVVLEILGPNHRPVQTTDDLPGFWRKLYPALRKELSRKYPRHEWR